MAKNLTTSSIARPSRIYPNRDFGLKNAIWQPCNALKKKKKNV
jgi:hypothetical protein